MARAAWRKPRRRPVAAAATRLPPTATVLGMDPAAAIALAAALALEIPTATAWRRRAPASAPATPVGFPPAAPTAAALLCTWQRHAAELSVSYQEAKATLML